MKKTVKQFRNISTCILGMKGLLSDIRPNIPNDKQMVLAQMSELIRVFSRLFAFLVGSQEKEPINESVIHHDVFNAYIGLLTAKKALSKAMADTTTHHGNRWERLDNINSELAGSIHTLSMLLGEIAFEKTENK